MNDVNKYNESLKYLMQLHIPDGFELESIVVQNAESMTEAYQEAMLNSNAKYKIYIHQDVQIIYRKFIDVVIKCFTENPEYGIMGVVGSSDLPKSGIWWQGRLIGSIRDDHTGIMKNYSYTRNTNKILEAYALDGLILMTQYDVDWRTDIFNKWHFYDLSQCMEFRLKGYKAAVLPQVMPTCVHRCGKNKMIGYEEERIKFLNEYKL